MSEILFNHDDTEQSFNAIYYATCLSSIIQVNIKKKKI